MRTLSEAGQKVFNARYAARDEDGNIIETFEQAVWRLANCAASVEQDKEHWANKFAEVIGNLEFIPATPIWANMGKPDRPWMPGSCFVLDVEDSLESMYQTLKDTALVFKAGGGVGYNFSKIRPRGDLVRTTKGKASGVVELIRLYNASSNMVVQGGVRRGASMGILNVDHPEIEDFIRCKLDGSITNFNLSIGVTDEFMYAVKDDADWDLRFNGKVYKTVKARYLWDLIAECAWACGDPGIIFLDVIQDDNPVPERVINATNPCLCGDTLVLTDQGEFPIKDLVGQKVNVWNGFEWSEVVPFVSGRNVPIVEIFFSNGKKLRCTYYHNFVLNDGRRVEAKNLRLGDELLRYKLPNGEDVQGITVEMMVFRDPEELEPYVYCFTEPKRHLGCFNGIVTGQCGEQPLYPGESCLLGSLSLDKFIADGEVDWYRLREVTRIAVRFLDNMIDVAEYPLPIIEQNTKATRKIGLGVTGLHDALIMLGLPYDSEEGRLEAYNILWGIRDEAESYSVDLANEKGNFPKWGDSIYGQDNIPMRNASCITIAPTGSVTTLAGCEGYGIEPIFAIAYRKSTNVAGDFEVFSPLFKKACKERGIPQEVMSEVARRGSCQGVDGIPEDIQRLFKGAQDIRPEDHILMQIELQRCVDNAISKTVNLPNSATVDDIKRIYKMAWEGNLKGVTVFRDGCKEGVITVGEGAKNEKPILRRGEIIPRPKDAQGITTCLETGCGKVYLTVNHINGEIIETFITTGSGGGCLIYTEAASRLISLALRGGISVEEICEQLNSTHSCPSYQYARGKGKMVSPGRSCASAIANKLIKIKHILNSETITLTEETDVCPECNAKMERAEGCMVCKECGFSKC